MHAHPGRTLGSLVIVAVAVLAAVGLVLIVAPEAHLVILVGGTVLGLVLYGLMYAVQRRRHW